MPLKVLFQTALIILFFSSRAACAIKYPDFAGQFYPQEKEKLSSMVEGFLEKAENKKIGGHVFALIVPHAGYGFSGQIAAYGYKLVANQPYKTVIILGTTHRHPANGAALYPQGSFQTSLGPVVIDEDFIKKISGRNPEVLINEKAFDEEHSVEVQLPFLQKTLKNFKIVPVLVGDCSLESCKKIADLLNEAIGKRSDTLLIVSSDFYHGYDPQEASKTDLYTLDLIKKFDYENLYYSLRDGSAQACGGFAMVIALAMAKQRGVEVEL